jgi:2-oxoglutarate ferredoxin oxidoreductase subunit beta
MSTLCAGCGHDSITAALIEACFEMDLPAHRIAKVSGIGCSSKAPTYFLSRSHGFNSVHGRMPSITTGANLANRDLGLHRRIRATAIPLPSVSASSAMPCAAA